MPPEDAREKEENARKSAKRGKKASRMGAPVMVANAVSSVLGLACTAKGNVSPRRDSVTATSMASVNMVTAYAV